MFPLACAAALTVISLSHRRGTTGPCQAQSGTPAQPAAAQQPQAAAPVPQAAPSMLQQPAGEAQIVFSGDTLSIRADNSSLTAILHQVAGKSGMQIEGLSGDERVFGTFGPGAPRDVLADLLNGTAYNLVLLGDLGNGAPRQLILTPATHGGAALPPPAQTNTDEAGNEPEPRSRRHRRRSLRRREQHRPPHRG